mgnify:CR=1 FL=1
MFLHKNKIYCYLVLNIFHEPVTITSHTSHLMLFDTGKRYENILDRSLIAFHKNIFFISGLALYLGI